jgi:hypothetical protein
METVRQNIDAKMKEIQSTQWNQTNQQLATQASDAYSGARVILDKIKDPNTSDADRIKLTELYDSLVNQGNNALAKAQENTIGTGNNTSADFPIPN